MTFKSTFHLVSSTLMLSLLATGCGGEFLLLSMLTGNHNGHSSPQGEVITDPLEAYHARPLETTQFETVSIVRKKQNTIRTDCNGHVTSNGLETINSLSKKMTINYSHRKDAWSYEVYNRTTKSGNRGLLVDQGRFIIDYSPTVFNMKVNEGANDVEYVFKKCAHINTNADGHESCKSEAEIMKEGIVRIDVLYSVVIVPGEQTFPATNCPHPEI